MVATGDLPCHVTQLHLRAGQQLDAALPVKARDAVLNFSGSLSSACLHMPPFGGDVRHLERIPCLKHLSELHMIISLEGEVSRSKRWFPGVFSHLQSLHITVLGTSALFAPSWDLSPCTSLQNFSLEVFCGQHTDLCRVHHIKVPAFRLHFNILGDGGDRACPMICHSWSVSKADITYLEFLGVQGELSALPQCVTDAIGALACTMAPPPVITVNGMLPGAAAKLICSRRLDAIPASDTDSDVDD